MSRVVVTITDGKGHARDLDLPMDVPVGQWAPAVAEAIEHADLGSADERVKYILKFQGSGEIVTPDRTLAAAGAVHGDILTLLVKPLPRGLAGRDAPRHFAGPGFVAADGQVFPLRRPNSTVGRADPASGVAETLLAVDLTDLDDASSPSVSRRHAQILFRKGDYLLNDLKSTNGTRINGKSLGQGDRVCLKHGDEVQFGEVALTFIWDSQE